MSDPALHTGTSTAPSGERQALKLTGLLKSSGLVVGARFAGVGIGFAIQILLARLLNAADLGMFFMAISTAMVLSIIHTLGFPMLVPRIAADASRRQAPGEISSFMHLARRDLIIMSVLLSALVLIGLWSWPQIDSTLRICLSIGVITAPFMGIMRLNGALANAMRHFSLGFIPELVMRPLLLFGLIACLWAYLPQFGLIIVLLGHLPLVMVLAFWQSRKTARFRKAEPATTDSPEPFTRTWKTLRKQGGAMLVAMLFTGVIADLNLLFAGLMLDNREIGIFGVCLKISMISAFAVQAVHQISMRDTADAVRGRDHAEIRSVLLRTNWLSLTLSLGALAGALLFGEWILGIFGGEFVEGYLLLIILMSAQVLRAAAGPATHMLAVIGAEQVSIPVFGGSLVMLLISNAVLVPIFGMMGAAIAFLAVMAVWPFLLAYVVWRKTNINPLISLP